MRQQFLLYLDETTPGALPALRIAAAEAGATLRSIATAADAAAIVREIAPATVAAVLIGPGVARPLDAAREIGPLLPGAHVVFLTAGPQAEPLLLALRSEPPAGAGWSVVDPDDDLLPAILRDLLRSRERRTAATGRDASADAGRGTDAEPDRGATGSERYLASILLHAIDAVLAVSLDDTITVWNREAEQLLERNAGEMRGIPIEEIVAPECLPALREMLGSIRSGGPPVRRELLLAGRDGSRIDVALSMAPILDEDGGRIGISMIAHDIGERRERERERIELLERERRARADAEIARRRFAFLAESSELLASSLDYETTLASVTRLAVPHIGDWCAVDMLNDEGMPERLAVAHVDPAKVEWAWELYRLRPIDMSQPTGLPNVLRTGRPEFYPVITEEMLRASARDEEELRLVLGIGFTSAMVVPIVVDGATVGAITFVTTTESGREYDEADLTLGQELARRAGLAIGSARLYREAQRQREALRVTLASIGDAVITTDTSGRITFMNDVARQLTGWVDEQALGRELVEVFAIVNEHTRLPAENPVGRVLASGAVVGLANHTILIARDGTELPIADSAAPIRDDDGGVLGVVMVFHDITERYRAERERMRLLAEVKAERRRLEDIVGSVPGIVWEAWGRPEAAGQRIDFVSRYVETMLGYGIEEWLSTPNFWLTIVHPEDREKAAAGSAQNFDEGGGVNRFRWMTKDGRAIWIESHSMVIHDETGAPIGMRGVSMDITERKGFEEQLREETETLATVNRIGRTISGELDLEKLVQAVTDAATELTGARFGSFFYNTVDADGPSYMLFTLSGVPREHFARFPMPRATDLFGPTFRGEEIIRLEDVRNDPRYGRNSPYYGIPEGHLPVVSYLAVPVISRSGEVLGGLFFGHPAPGVFTERHEQIVAALAAQTAIAMDNARLFLEAQAEIEERRRTETALQSAKESAEAANRAKDQFLAMLSHELRTPLTPVLALTHVLESEPGIPEDLRPVIEMVRRNVELEARLIDDLLDLTRIAKGKLQLNIEPADLHALLRNVLEICRSEINGKHLALTVTLVAPRHWALVDSARMQQVFWNLIKNAVKFTPERGVIAIRSFNDDEGRFLLEVSDNGIGIEPELLPTIFRPFEQGERITRQYGGLGLGLAISRAVMEMHDGVLTAVSPGPGLGATFTVGVEAAETNGAEHADDPDENGERERNGAIHILLVDDHVETGRVLRMLLERRGYRVQVAHTVDEALQQALEHRFDLLISDIGLPDGSGLDILRALREQQPIAAIALSGFGMEEDIQRSRDAGFEEHLIKPVSFQKLQDSIRRLGLGHGRGGDGERG